MQTVLLQVAFLFVLLVATCSGQDGQSSANDTHTSAYAGNEDKASYTQKCSIEGNPDLYGLGIRLGVYFQLLFTLIANHLLPDALGNAWDANAVFLVAILIASLNSSVEKDGFTSPEAFVMLQMMLAFLLAVFNISNIFWNIIEGVSRIVEGTLYPGARINELYSELGFVRLNPSGLGSSARSLLGLAIAAYSVWFWYGGGVGLDAGLNCKPEVFLFAQLAIHGRAKYFFMTLSIIYLLNRALDLAVVVFPVPQLAFLLTLTKRGDADPEAQALDQRNQLFGPLDPRPLFDRPGATTREGGFHNKRKRYDHRSSRRRKIIAHYWHSITFSGSALIISWSIIAIESTLVWNGISGIYNVTSTGQLIPLVVGIAGIIKTAVQLAVQQWKKDRQERPYGQPLELGEKSTWRYRLRNRKTVEFDATPQTRRWSLDDLEDAALKPLQRPSKPKDDRMAPIYPVLAADEDWRVRKHARDEGWRRPEMEIYPSHARWLYQRSHGTYHIFHDLGRVRRRWSFDEREEVFQDAEFCMPYPARMKAFVPLDQKLPLEDLLAEKAEWRMDEMRRRQRGGIQDDHSSLCLTQGPEDEIWPAGDHETVTPHQPDILRRWSLPNLDDPHVSLRYDSWSRASSNSRRTSEQTDSGKSQVKKRHWVLESVAGVFKFLFMLINLMACCGPCTFLYMKYKQIKRRRRFQSSKAATGLEKFVLEAPDPLCECRMCDLDFSDGDWDPNFPNTARAPRPSHDRTKLSYYFSPRYTLQAIGAVPLFLINHSPLTVLWRLGERRKWGRKIKAVLNYEILPAIEVARDQDRKPVEEEVADTIRGRQVRRKYEREKVLDPERAKGHQGSVAPSDDYDSDDVEQRREHRKRRLQRIAAALNEAAAQRGN